MPLLVQKMLVFEEQLLVVDLGSMKYEDSAVHIVDIEKILVVLHHILPHHSTQCQ